MTALPRTIPALILLPSCARRSSPPRPCPPTRAPRAPSRTILRQMQAEESRSRDQRVADRIEALANNPASPVLANPKGDITIIEFSDYACPYCKAAEPRLMALVNADKRVRLVMKEYPILTRASMTASRMALAANKQGKYRQFHLALMRREGALDEAGIFETAKSVGLDIARAKRDMLAAMVQESGR